MPTSEVSWVEERMILSATRGTPPRYNVLRMFLHAGGEGGGFSILLDIKADDNRERGERTQGK